jgi:dTDP-4-dehydrorhamnose 3,5-epimerase
MNITIGEKNYNRLTIPPMIWFAFQGISSNNLLLNIANIEHLKSEAENKSLEQIRFDW